MMGHEHHHEQHAGGAYFVRRPRITDSVGESLRSAFDGSAALPDEFNRMLARIDRAASRNMPQ
jgi:hypothetical protein